MTPLANAVLLPALPVVRTINYFDEVFSARDNPFGSLQRGYFLLGSIPLMTLSLSGHFCFNEASFPRVMIGHRKKKALFYSASSGIEQERTHEHAMQINAVNRYRATGQR